jgi:hypothetical protein
MNSSIVRTNRLTAENGLYLPVASSGGGGGGITELTGDVLAGPAVGTTPATVVRINGATVPAAGALTTGAVLRVTGPSSLGYGQVNLALPAAVTGLLPVANIAPSGTNGFVLTTTGGATVWAAPASGGITQLTGDVTAGPGSGSVVATVVRINGATVPAAGALTTGNVLQVSGASALSYGPLNLALPAAVTGLLSVANIAPAGTNGFVLTTVGGATVWAAAGGGGGITQLTQDVLAGPGSGSQVATVAQITGVAGVANVVNGTDLSFLTTGGTVSTLGRINFTKNAQTFLAYQDTTGVDRALIKTDGADTLQFGGSGAGQAVQIVGGFSLSLTASGASNSISIASAGVVVNATKWTHNSTPAYFDSASNVTIGGTTADFGGAAGMLAFAPLTTAPTTAPATNGLLGQGPDGLHYGAPNATPAYLTDYMLAPDWQGANNTQASKKLEYAGEGRGVGAGSTTLLTIQVPLGNVITIRVLATARDVAGGTVGDGLSVDTIFQFQNVGGTVTQATTLATPLTASSASLVGVLSVTASVSGTNALVNGVATVAAAGLTIDWTAIATVIVD